METSPVLKARERDLTPNRFVKPSGGKPKEKKFEKKQSSTQLSKGKQAKRSSQTGELQAFSRHLVEIPTYKVMPIREQKRRWRFANAFANSAFEIIDGHRQFAVIVGSGASNVRSFVDMWRIKEIRVFAHATDDEEMSTFRITPVGQDSNDNFLNDIPQILSVRSGDQSGYNVLHVKPTLDHPLGMWHSTSAVNPNAQLFLMTANLADSNSMLEITFEYVDNYSGITNGFVETSSVISLGQIGGWSLFGTNAVLQDANSLG
jgi:hypothetical protein